MPDEAQITEVRGPHQVAAGEVGDVLQVFIWESQPGRTAETIEAAMGAKAIHEKAGASVSITVDQLGRMHYVMQFDSWEEWGKFQDTPNPEFATYMAPKPTHVYQLPSSASGLEALPSDNIMVA